MTQAFNPYEPDLVGMDRHGRINGEYTKDNRSHSNPHKLISKSPDRAIYTKKPKNPLGIDIDAGQIQPSPKSIVNGKMNRRGMKNNNNNRHTDQRTFDSYQSNL